MFLDLEGRSRSHGLRLDRASRAGVASPLAHGRWHGNLDRELVDRSHRGCVRALDVAYYSSAGRIGLSWWSQFSPLPRAVEKEFG